MNSLLSNWKNSTNAMESQSQNTSLQKLHIVEKRVVRVLEIAGAVMDELSNSTGPRMEMLNTHCREFMQLIKDIQMTLREEIRSACEYRPFEKCDYSSKISNEICCKKLEHIIEQLDNMKQSICQYQDADPNTSRKKHVPNLQELSEVVSGRLEKEFYIEKSKPAPFKLVATSVAWILGLLLHKGFVANVFPISGIHGEGRSTSDAAAIHSTMPLYGSFDYTKAFKIFCCKDFMGNEASHLCTELDRLFLLQEHSSTIQPSLAGVLWCTPQTNSSTGYKFFYSKLDRYASKAELDGRSEPSPHF